MTPERVWCKTNSNKLVIVNTIEALIMHSICCWLVSEKRISFCHLKKLISSWVWDHSICRTEIHMNRMFTCTLIKLYIKCQRAKKQIGKWHPKISYFKMVMRYKQSTSDIIYKYYNHYEYIFWHKICAMSLVGNKLCKTDQSTNIHILPKFEHTLQTI